MTTQSSQSVLLALVGNPNCGKTALFNRLTGGRQKVGNYPGVTVERKEGHLDLGSLGTRTITVLDLPGVYSLKAKTPDEAITRDAILGKIEGEKKPDYLIAVADATNLERTLGLVLELIDLNLPVILALNMMDLAHNRGLEISIQKLSEELGIPVVSTVAVKRNGAETLIQMIHAQIQGGKFEAAVEKKNLVSPSDRFKKVDEILSRVISKSITPTLWTDKIDRVVLHPVWGALILLMVLGFVFQAMFVWASVPQDLIEGALSSLGNWVGSQLGEGDLKNLLVDGVIAGVGSVVVFLPQILILFTFILVLEDTGYMARAAFLMDRLMGSVGLHGRAFIPMLSSFACAIPGVMATRTIENPRDRLITILVAPLMTCSARLPVYTLIIGTFVPEQTVGGLFSLQGVVMLSLYLSGIFAALFLAWGLKRFAFKGQTPPLLLELPTYKRPSLRSLGLGLFDRAKIFLKRAGTVILSLSILIWFLASYPKAPEGALGTPIEHSYAGKIGKTLEPIFKPIGFDWRIAVALIPGFAAREVMVSALGTVYAVEASDEDAGNTLGPVLKKDWSLATALSLLVWYIFAMQCLSTIAVVKRETNGWKWPMFQLGLFTAMAYLGSYVTFNLVHYFSNGS